MSKASKESTCCLCDKDIQIGDNISWSRKGQPRQWHLNCNESQVAIKDNSKVSKKEWKSKYQLKIKSVPGLEGDRALRLRLKNPSGQYCLEGHRIVPNEPYGSLSNAYGASDSILCLDLMKNRGYINERD